MVIGSNGDAATLWEHKVVVSGRARTRDPALAHLLCRI
jgi:hypothetical protein